MNEVNDAIFGLCGYSSVAGGEDNNFDEVDSSAGDSDLEPVDLAEEAILVESQEKIDPALLEAVQTLAAAVGGDRRDIEDIVMSSLSSRDSLVPDAARRLFKKAHLMIVNQLQPVARMMANSPNLLAELEKECKVQNIPFKIIPQSVKTQWNSCYKMLEPLFALWEPLNVMLRNVKPKEHARYCAAFQDHQDMSFKPTDFAVFEQMKKFLQLFYTATVCLSKEIDQRLSLPFQ
ncbi:hypothetical protein BDR26DRAFT_904490 [Obelidium mucronatum]|nr:hypothetical protein BDR26DRAFT_904490 [Obelidium mucronatum]